MKELYAALGIDPEQHTPEDMMRHVTRARMLYTMDRRKVEERRREILMANRDTIAANLLGAAEDPAVTLETSESMEERFDTLSPLIRRTMVRCYSDGYTPEEIAEEERVAPKAIYERLRVGRNILKGETQ